MHPASKIVAIDGPSASGKSTVARRVALELDFLYVDSGSLYRGVTWMALREGAGVVDLARLCDMMANIDIDFFSGDGVVGFTIDGIDPTEELRTGEVNENVSCISVVPEVRSEVVAWLRNMVMFGNLVMEGRDIGSAVFPEAEFKFYLDASSEVRARRRHGEIVDEKEDISIIEVRESLERRDAIDRGRETDPLIVAPGAVIIDSTSMSVEEVTRLIVKKIAL